MSSAARTEVGNRLKPRTGHFNTLAIQLGAQLVLGIGFLQVGKPFPCVVLVEDLHCRWLYWWAQSVPQACGRHAAGTLITPIQAVPTTAV